jgi:hypothetical protein
MEKHVKGLLSALRQAINEAILGSHDVNAALSALSRTGVCPSFAVDVMLEGAEEHLPSLEGSGELCLTEVDEEFLRSMGIKVEGGGRLASAVPLK